MEQGSEEDYQTPSSADSAVGDLEQVLREKEGEIVYLRDTLEQNEQVIFRVYEEKEKTWAREIRKIKVKAFLHLTFCHAPFDENQIYLQRISLKLKIIFLLSRVCMRRS